MTSQTVQRKGFKRVIKTHKDLPSFIVSFEIDKLLTEVVLFERNDDGKTRPLLGIRNAFIEKEYLNWRSEKFYPVTIDEALSIVDGSLVPNEYDEATNSFKHWEGELERDESDYVRGYIVYRLLKHDVNKKPTEKQKRLLIEYQVWRQANWFFQSFKHFKV